MIKFYPARRKLLKSEISAMMDPAICPYRIKTGLCGPRFTLLSLRIWFLIVRVDIIFLLCIFIDSAGI